MSQDLASYESETLMNNNLFFLNRIDHLRLRKLALPAFSPRIMDQMKVRFAKLVKERFDEIGEPEEFNFATEVAEIIPTQAIASLVGIPRDKFPIFDSLAYGVVRGINPMLSEDERKEATKGVKAGLDLLNELIDERRKKWEKPDLKIKSGSTNLGKNSKINFNIGSPKQLGEILFDKMKIEGGKRSKNGSWQTSVEILEKISDMGYEIGDIILNWRHFSKLKSTYTDALVEQINKKTHRVHTNYSMVGASTGRLSSSNPNLQNIPIRTEEGRLIRTAFEPKQGFKLVSMDYSQIELRLIAHIADENKMLDAFNDNLDIHADTASKVFGIPIKEMTSEFRRKAKAINFGIIYGISAYGLAKQLKCSANEAKDFISSYLSLIHISEPTRPY